MDNNGMMRQMLGSGMAGQAADKMSLYPQWQQEYIQAVSNGDTQFPQFEEWMKMKQMQMAQGQMQPPGGLLK